MSLLVGADPDIDHDDVDPVIMSRSTRQRPAQLSRLNDTERSHSQNSQSTPKTKRIAKKSLFAAKKRTVIKTVPDETTHASTITKNISSENAHLNQLLNQSKLSLLKPKQDVTVPSVRVQTEP